MSLLRCPYCHESVDAARERWVACAACLARHHEACFSETATCSSCGGVEALDPVMAQTYRTPEKKRAEWRRLARGAAIFAALAVVEAGIGLAVGWDPVLWRVLLLVGALLLGIAAIGIGIAGVALLALSPFLLIAKLRKKSVPATPAREPEPVAAPRRLDATLAKDATRG